MSRSRVDRRELLGLGAIVVIAAAVRFVGLPGRGTWDADQGHDMLVLLKLVRDGQIPLLGPPTSIGAFHHGALYYYLLAPAAFVSAADPTVVVAAIALAGIAAVAVTWWLARSISGPIAGFVAALLMALSASAIDESTFIWNPNLIALSSAVALAAAWRGRTTGRARWWLLAAFGLLVTMQCHVLGVALFPPIVAFWVATWRVTPAGPERQRLTWAGLGGIALIALGYVPLLAYELGHDFAESRAALAFIASGGTGVTIALPIRLLFVGLRILAWPLTGLLTNGLVIGVVVGVVVVVGLAWRAGAGSGRERTAARWLLATLAFGWVVLTFGAAGLSTVTPLPVDHYHAFLDPVVFVALGMVVAAVWHGLQLRLAAGRADRQVTDGGAGGALPQADVQLPATDGAPAIGETEAAGPEIPANGLRAGLAGIVVCLVVLIAWNVVNWPPAVARDGGWPAARIAADRIEAAAGDRPIQLIGLPTFKSTEAYGFPLERDGRAVVEAIPLVPIVGGPVPDPTAAAVVLCDALFVQGCGGPAEDAEVESLWPGPLSLVDRWEPAPGRTISVYLPAP